MPNMTNELKCTNHKTGHYWLYVVVHNDCFITFEGRLPMGDGESSSLYGFGSCVHMGNIKAAKPFLPVTNH